MLVVFGERKTVHEEVVSDFCKTAVAPAQIHTVHDLGHFVLAYSLSNYMRIEVGFECSSTLFDEPNPCIYPCVFLKFVLSVKNVECAVKIKDILCVGLF